MSDKLSVLNQAWYAPGLRFSCTGCGKCCTGSPGYTWLSLDEIERMAAYLEISIEDFGSRYLRQVGERYALLEHPTTFACVFLDGKACRVYPVRPTQCQTFPFWPDNLSSQGAWNEAAKHCEGICDAAPIVPLDEIERQKKRQMKAERAYSGQDCDNV